MCVSMYVSWCKSKTPAWIFLIWIFLLVGVHCSPLVLKSCSPVVPTPRGLRHIRNSFWIRRIAFDSRILIQHSVFRICSGTSGLSITPRATPYQEFGFTVFDFGIRSNIPYYLSEKKATSRRLEKVRVALAAFPFGTHTDLLPAEYHANGPNTCSCSRGAAFAVHRSCAMFTSRKMVVRHPILNFESCRVLGLCFICTIRRHILACMYVSVAKH
jgi:hypothetical protein